MRYTVTYTNHGRESSTVVDSRAHRTPRGIERALQANAVAAWRQDSRAEYPIGGPRPRIIVTRIAPAIRPRSAWSIFAWWCTRALPER